MERKEEGPKGFLRFLTLSSGCWRSLGTWKSALMFTRPMQWPHSERITLGSHMPGCALVGMRPARAAPRLLPVLM